VFEFVCFDAKKDLGFSIVVPFFLLCFSLFAFAFAFAFAFQMFCYLVCLEGIPFLLFLLEIRRKIKKNNVKDTRTENEKKKKKFKVKNLILLNTLTFYLLSLLAFLAKTFFQRNIR